MRAGSKQSNLKQTNPRETVLLKSLLHPGDPSLCCFPALPFVLCKHLLTHIFVSTIAFLTVNFRASSQDKGICEQTAVLIVALYSAECLPSNICLCDTLGLPRAVGCPSAACPRPSDAHHWDIPLSAGLRPGHPLGGRPLSCPLLGFPPTHSQFPDKPTCTALGSLLPAPAPAGGKEGGGMDRACQAP